MIRQFTKKAKMQGWEVEVNNIEGGEMIELHKYSPAGQDFILSLYIEKAEDIIQEIENYVENFDPSENAMLWLDETGHGKNGAPYEMGAVYEDMVNCQIMMEELLTFLKNDRIKRTVYFDKQSSNEEISTVMGYFDEEVWGLIYFEVENSNGVETGELIQRVDVNQYDMYFEDEDPLKSIFLDDVISKLQNIRDK